MTVDDFIRILRTEGWRVFTESHQEGWHMVGITKLTGIGVEGVGFCEISASGNTLLEAFDGIFEQLELKKA